MMPKSLYDGGKQRRHFTLSDQAYSHLTAIAHDARISRSEAIERLVRCTPVFEGSAMFSNGAWPLVIDHSSSS